jgi:hypothetical protein
MESTKNYREQNVVYYVLGTIEALLVLRLLFKLLGANTSSGFVSFLYSLTNVFILPFIGIFRVVATTGSVFEPASAVAMIIYALIGYRIVRLIRL